MKVQTSVKAGGLSQTNHNQAAVVIKTGVKAGRLSANHAQTPARR